MAAVAMLVASSCSTSASNTTATTDANGTNTTIANSADRRPTTSVAPSTALVTTTTDPTVKDPVLAVKTTNLQASDIGVPTSTEVMGGINKHSNDQCAAISNSPFLANESSDIYVTGAGFRFNSQVAVEPSVAEAVAVTTAMASTDLSQRCLTAGLQASVANSSDQVGCDIQVVDPHSTVIDTAELGPGIQGTKFTASLQCFDVGIDETYYQDTLVVNVGPIVVALTIRSNGIEPSDLEHQVIRKLQAHARDALAR